MNAYKTVFEITNKGFDWWFAAAGLGFVVLGVILIKVGRIKQWRGMQRWAGYIMFAFATFWTLIAFAATYPDYHEALQAYRTGQYSTVEGTVENFRPMPYSGHQLECFTVRDQEFCYSDYVVTAGFNNTASHGGPIRAGLPVRIAYRGQEILRIEIRQDSVPTAQERQATVDASRKQWENWQQHDPQLDKLTLGFSIAALFMVAWWNLSWKRFMKFWLKPPYRRVTEIGFRLFFAANLVGALWYVVSQIIRVHRAPRDYLDVMGISAAWILVIILMVHFVEWQARRARTQ